MTKLGFGKIQKRIAVVRLHVNNRCSKCMSSREVSRCVSYFPKDADSFEARHAYIKHCSCSTILQLGTSSVLQVVENYDHHLERLVLFADVAEVLENCLFLQLGL